MKSQTTSVLGLLAASAAAHKTCKSFKIPVSVDSKEMVYALPPVESDFDVAAFVDTISSRSAPEASSYFSGSKNVSKTYEVGATFCTPAKGGNDAHKDTLLVATHGLGFDRSYWGPQIDEDLYSFVDFVIAEGYSIFYYDRLGVGESSQLSGYEAQISTQISVLRELVAQIKDGKWVAPLCQAEKIVLVGHSFGSGVSIGALGADESLADGLILTGFSLNAEYLNIIGNYLGIQPRIAAQQHPGKWRQLDTGYWTTGDVYSNVNSFFAAPDYDHQVARFVEDHKHPFAIMELLTAVSVDKLPTTFEGPVMIISGQRDFIFCTSDCDGILDTPAATVFSKSEDFRAISYPGSGHALNLHLNATGAFGQITDFLSANGL